MRQLVLLISFLTYYTIGNAQFNDTLTYKSGMVKVVDVTKYDEDKINFVHVNSKDKEVASSVSTNKLKKFVIYDENNNLVYDSNPSGGQMSDHDIQRKYPDTVSVSKHQFSINPFAIPLLSLNTRYTYTFGEKMLFSSITRFTIASLFFENTEPFSGVWIGTGLKITPYYGKKFSFGMDVMPLFVFNESSIDPIVIIPLTADFDLFFNDRIGVAMDFGFGPRFSDGQQDYVVRGHLGVLWQFKNKKTFATKYR